jgi:SAM-dependent methyltransferase
VRDPQDDYAQRVREGLDVIEVSGRYPSQTRDERYIVDDVVGKLRLTADDDLLEIGCGPGTLLIPLAFRCASATGIDHADVLQLLQTRMAGPPHITTIAGDFLSLDVKGRFDAILAYSVLSVLPDRTAVFSFAHRAASLLRKGGRLLLGDVANPDKKRRFLESPAGIAFQREWDQRQRATPPTSLAGEAAVIGALDDRLITDLVYELRASGLDVYILPQPADLPFGHSREDLLVVAPA